VAVGEFITAWSISDSDNRGAAVTQRGPVRVAAVGDIHMDSGIAGTYRPALLCLGQEADVLLVAGDLTRHGTVAEAEVVARELADLPVPVFVVLGNHDHHNDEAELVTKTLESAGITVLEGSGAVIDCRGVRLGIAGTKGFGGGFANHRGSEFGEPEMKAFMRYSRSMAEGLGTALRELDCDVRIGMTHYASCLGTLEGEPPELYSFLGSQLLADALESAPNTVLGLHGHAHAGTEIGTTTGGIAIRNVAYPVIRKTYQVYEIAAPTPVGA
jgi:Icc-related predicted phosphoesterase